MLSVFGFSVFILIFGGMMWANARRWRYIAGKYDEPRENPIEKRSMQSAVLLGLGGYNSLKGIVTIGIHKTGVSFRVMTPFALFHSPIFIPYGDIRGWKTSWYLDARSTELEFRRAPDIKMVVSAEQADWMRKFAGHKMPVKDVSPPNGNAGQGWRLVPLVHGALAIAMVAILSANYLAQ